MQQSGANKKKGKEPHQTPKGKPEQILAKLSLLGPRNDNDRPSIITPQIK